MSGREHALVVALRDHLHDANDELSIATMQLQLLLEAGSLDAAATRAIKETLDACQAATSALRDAWLVLSQSDPG